MRGSREECWSSCPTIGLRLLPAAVLAASIGCNETIAASYATYADAERDGAVARGWMPPFVPRSATDIREVHDLDTNQQWLRFRVPPGDSSVAAGATSLSVSEARQLTPKPPRAIGAWLPELRDPPLVTPRSSIRAYRHPGTGPAAMCVALDTHESEAYAWTCASDAAQASGRATIHSVSADGDTAFTLDSDDAEMANARRLARCTLHEFGRRFKSSPATQTELSLKSRFSDVNDTEYLWVDVVDIVGDTLFRGTVANDPAGVEHLKYGDTVAVRAADVADWFAIDRDTLIGGFTLRVYRRRLAPAERAHEDNVRGYTVTEDSDAYRRLTSRCAGRGP